MGRKKKNVKNSAGSPKSRLIGSFIIALMLVVILIAIGGIAYPHLWIFLCQQDMFSLEEICFVHNGNLDESELRALLPEIIGSNLFAIDLESVKRALQCHPWVDEVVLQRRLPHKLIISIGEKRPVALIAAGSVWAVSKNGILLPLDKWQGALDLPLLKQNRSVKLKSGTHLEGEQVHKMLQYLEKMRYQLPEIWYMISEVTWDRKGRLLFNLTGTKTQLILGTNPRWQQILDFYSFLIYEGGRAGIEGIETIDLRFSGRVVIKRKNVST